MGTITRSPIVKEWVHWDTLGTGEAVTVPDGAGGTVSRTKVNSGHLPTTTAVRVKSATAIDVATALVELFTADALKLPLAGGTMSGALAMGSNKVTGLASGSASGDALHAGQVDATTIELSGGALKVKDGSINITQLAATLSELIITKLSSDGVWLATLGAGPSPGAGIGVVYQDGSHLYFKLGAAAPTQIDNQTLAGVPAYDSGWQSIAAAGNLALPGAALVSTNISSVVMLVREGVGKQEFVVPNGASLNTTGADQGISFTLYAVGPTYGVNLRAASTYIAFCPGAMAWGGSAWTAEKIATGQVRVKVWLHS